MLSKEKFLQGMTYLKAIYLNFALDTTNQMAMNVWYGELKEIDDEVFIAILKQYTKSKQFPPQSPYDILNTIETYQDEHKAWETILSVIKKSFNNSSFLTTMYKDYPSLYQFVKDWDIENVPLDKYENKCYGYHFGKPFKRAYKEFLKSKKIVKFEGGRIERTDVKQISTEVETGIKYLE